MSEKIKIVEVGPRDGLQNEAKTFSVEDRAQLIQLLVKAGVNYLEGGSFVSPKAIPQMQSSDEVFSKVKDLPADISFLVPNQKGLDGAIAAGVKSIAIFSATSDSFNKKNINKSVEESLEVYRQIVPQALKASMRIRGYVSTAFGCPYEGAQDPNRLVYVVEELFKMGCYEVSVGDTIGVAQPKQVSEVFRILRQRFEVSKLAAHMHDTRGFALVNIKSAIDEGCRIIDASVGGLGGCPYAKGSSGNVATEEVVQLVHGLGFDTGISLPQLLEIAKWVEERLDRKLKAKFYLSQPKLSD